MQGSTNVVRLLQQLKPKVVVPLQNATFPMKGPLSSLIYEEDSANTLTARLKQANVNGVRVQLPGPTLEPVTVDVTQ